MAPHILSTNSSVETLYLGSHHPTTSTTFLPSTSPSLPTTFNTTLIHPTQFNPILPFLTGTPLKNPYNLVVSLTLATITLTCRIAAGLGAGQGGRFLETTLDVAAGERVFLAL
jgi:hypothetical protein